MFKVGDYVTWYDPTFEGCNWDGININPNGHEVLEVRDDGTITVRTKGGGFSSSMYKKFFVLVKRRPKIKRNLPQWF